MICRAPVCSNSAGLFSGSRLVGRLRRHDAAGFTRRTGASLRMVEACAEAPFSSRTTVAMFTPARCASSPWVSRCCRRTALNEGTAQLL